MVRSHFDPADGPRLMRGILENPADDQPRIAYSDWLEDRDGPGDRERAEFIRLQIKIARLPEVVRVRSVMSGREYEDRDGIISFPNEPPPEVLREVWQLDRLLVEYSAWNPELFDLQAQEREMIGKHWIAKLLGTTDAVRRLWPEGEMPSIKRGFVNAVSMTCDQFMKHAEQLFREHPITKVVLTDRRPWIINMGYDLHLWLSESVNVLQNEMKLPLAIFERLEGYQPQVFNNEPDRRYRTNFDAMEASSAACVQWGREQAKLPPLEPANGIKPEVGANITDMVRQTMEVTNAISLEYMYRSFGLDRATAESPGESGDR